MYFPVAGIEIGPWIPPLVAFASSLLAARNDRVDRRR
jgi:hypothetical protein